jgi:hypothetical protein
MSFINAKRCGVTIVGVVLFLVTSLIVAALIVDVSYLYWVRADLQKAADAAALAGAAQLPYTDASRQKALEYAAANGYTDGFNGVSIITTPFANRYRVEIRRPVTLFFGWVIGFSQRSVSAAAVAEFQAKQPISIWGTGTYGIVGTQALEISGPYARYTYGDPYATKFLDDGSPNPTYNPNGYDFILFVPQDYRQRNGTAIVWLELYDATSGTYSQTGWTDEVYTYHGVSQQATTVFTIYAPDNTPNDLRDDVMVAQVTIGPNDSAYKLKWALPPNFAIDTNIYGTGRYRINVKTISGGGGNAFHMRAGPPRSGNQQFNPNNGTSISGSGNIQMFFQQNGTVTWKLGSVPPEAAGMTVHIRKFDTDIGAQSIRYEIRNAQGSVILSWTGQLSTNGTWKEDVYTLPSAFPGGDLYAIYTAGRMDTSVWEMWYEGVIEGSPARLRLVE